MPDPRPTDPFIVYSFALDMSGGAAGFFTEVSGVGSESEVVEHKVVGKEGHTSIVQKIPGRLKWTDITLKRGITATMDIWEWRKQVEDGDMAGARKNCSIIMYDETGKAAARWDIVNAWPSKVSGPSFKSDGNEYGVEEVTLVHEGLTRVKV